MDDEITWQSSSQKSKLIKIDSAEIDHCLYLQSLSIKRNRQRKHQLLNDQASVQLQLMKTLLQRLIKEEKVSELTILTTHAYLLQEQIKFQKEILRLLKPLLEIVLTEYSFLVKALEMQRRKFVVDGKTWSEDQMDLLTQQSESAGDTIEQKTKRILNWNNVASSAALMKSNVQFTSNFINTIIQYKSLLTQVEEQIMEATLDSIRNNLL